MIKKAPVRFVIGLTVGLSLALLVAVNSLLIWVASGPRSLDALTPYIESAFYSENSDYHIDVAHSWLVWGGFRHPINVRLQEVSVLTKDNATFSTFPEILLGVDMLSLPFGKILPTSLTINHPVISLFQHTDGSISFGLQPELPADEPTLETPVQPTSEEQVADTAVQEKASPEITSSDIPAPPSTEAVSAPEHVIPFENMLTPLLDPDGNSGLRKLRSINILDADVSIGNQKNGVFFNAGNANILLKRTRRGIIHIDTSATIHYEGFSSLISAQFSMSKADPLVIGKLTFGQLMPSALAKMFSVDPALEGIKFPVSGKAQAAIDKKGSLQQLDFSIDGGKGTIESEHLANAMNIESLHVEGILEDNAHKIQISKLDANLDGVPLTATGTVTLQEGDAAVKANASITNVPAKKVANFWPPSLAPITREWILENITEGSIPKAGVVLNIGFGDMAKPLLPREAVDATVELEDASIRYIPEHPKTEHVNAIIKVDGVGMEAKIASASYMTATKLSNGTLLIEDLLPDNPLIKLSFDAETVPVDVVTFLGLPRLEHAKRLGLNTDSNVGTIKGNAALEFYFFTPKDEDGKPFPDDGITYNIAADLAGVTQRGFMKKFDISNANGHMTINNTGLEYTGTASVNGADVTESSVKYLFTPENGMDTFIDVTATAPTGSLPKFGYPDFPFLKGSLGVKASVKQGDDLEISNATIDLSNASISLKDAAWDKPAGVPVTLDLTAEKKSGELTIPSFTLKGKGVNAAGSATLDKSMSDIKTVKFAPLHLGETNLDTATYAALDKGGIAIDVKGDSLDLSGWMKSDPDPEVESTFSFAHFPALQLKLDVARMIMSAGGAFAQVKGSVDCDNTLCKSANITGVLDGGKPFNFRILRNPKGQRQLSLRAEDAGAFLKILDIHEGIEGGDLTITGTYNDTVSPNIFNGKIDINEHVVKQAPILARILSLASLTGFFDTLQGKGIRFKKLYAPFTLSNDVLTFTEARTHGDAMGMTMEGTVIFPKRTLDLKGTIVPAYTLNNVLGKVPLVGDLLTGGEGQGVFAASYTVTGSEKKPDVSVNPLSILTPGFLRGIFDIPSSASEPEPAK